MLHSLMVHYFNDALVVVALFIVALFMLHSVDVPLFDVVLSIESILI